MEILNPVETGKRPSATPKQYVRVGFSLAGSTLHLGVNDQSVSFDSEGFFHSGNAKKTKPSQRFGRDQVVGVLLNLDAKSPNVNTLSLFKDGVRLCDPQPLPDSLKGATLYPHFAFKNVSLQLHFGPTPMYALPFKCQMLQNAACDDTELAAAMVGKDGKFEVVFPIGLPDEGTFQWLDGFLEKNPKYTELSDRKLIDWVVKSGYSKPAVSQWKNSNDKPDATFGSPALDELSARKVIQTVAPLAPRNYVMMEVKGNLLKEERAESLKRFSGPQFKRIAKVVMGDPPKDWMEAVHAEILAEKQSKLDIEYQARLKEKQRKKIAEERRKKVEEQRKKMEAAKKKVEEAKKEAAKKKKEADEARKKEEADKKEAAEKATAEEAKKKEEEPAKKEGEAGETKPEGDEAKTEAKEEVKTEEEKPAEIKEEVKKEEVKEEEKKEEVKAEEENADVVDVEMKEPEEPDEPPPKAELTEDELKVKFKVSETKDILMSLLNISYSKFELPSKDEGFTEIQYEWSNEAKAKEYMRTWILAKKKNTRIEDIQPSEECQAQLQEWQKVLQEWQLKQKEWKQAVAAKETAKAKEKADKKAAEEGEEKDEEMKDADAEGEKDEVKAADAEKKTSETAADDEPKGEEVKDIFSVKDVCDIGGGEPLFLNFGFEDWALSSLRFELDLLVKYFKKDVDDPDRPAIQEQHFSFYYNKYFRKQLNTRFFGMSNIAELFGLVKDTVEIKDGLVATLIKDQGEKPDLSMFVKLAEESRRERQRRIDAGDDSAKLKFSVLAASSPQADPKARGSVQGKAAPKWQSGSSWQGGGPANWQPAGGGLRPSGSNWQGKGGYAGKW